MRKLLTVAGVIVLLVAIVVGVGQWMNTANNGPGSPGGLGPGKPQAPTGAQGAVNPPGCAAYELISVPGTWESSASDDPLNPHANPRSFMLQISNPLRQEFSDQRLKVWTVPYTAQFRNYNALHEMSYDDSRREGFGRLSQELRDMHQACPATRFILTGFSQGAVIAGDMASDIGNGRGPIPADRVSGVALVADGRFERDRGVLVGNTATTGVGAEIALNPVSGIVQPIVPGATMRGPRPDGFGALNGKVNNFCAPTDMICDAPRDIGNAIQRAQDLFHNNAVHAQYATNPNVVPGQTTPQWIVGWARGLINS